MGWLAKSTRILLIHTLACLPARTVDQLKTKSNTSEGPNRIHAVGKEDLETRSLRGREPVRIRSHTTAVERGTNGEGRLRESASMSCDEAVFLGIPGGGPAILQMELIEYVMHVILDR